jgi:hypothetical protein
LIERILADRCIGWLEVVSLGEHRQLETIRNPDFLEDVGEMVFDRLLANPIPLRDVLVRAGVEDRGDDVALASGKPERVARFGPGTPTTKSVDEVGQTLAANPVLSRDDTADRFEQVGIAGRFQYDSAGAPLEGIQNRGLLDLRCQNDDARPERFGAERA